MRNSFMHESKNRSAGNATAALSTAALLLISLFFITAVAGAPDPKPPAHAEPMAGGFVNVAAPEGKRIDLFSGREEDVSRNWLRCGTRRPAEWKVKRGAMIASGGDICTEESFGDVHLHAEFKVPFKPKAHGQARGNSGIKLQGVYEIQILDSFGIAAPGSGDCGAVYSQSAPLVNACRPPRKWQSYDIVFRAPRFDPMTHAITERGRVTVIQNGIVVQNNQEITGVTGNHETKVPVGPGPILLQYHGNDVEFRNVWVVPLPPHGALHY